MSERIKLTPAPIATPMMDKEGNLNKSWQAWFSMIYESFRAMDVALKDLEDMGG